MPKTDKERLQDNNDDLQEIKTTINNLPEYQDIEPIYKTSDLSTHIIQPVIMTKRFDIYENYFICNWYDTSVSYSARKYYTYIYNINNDGSLTEFYHSTTEVSDNATHNIIWGIRNNKLYYTADLSNNWYFDVYDIDLETKEVNKTSIPFPTGSWSYAYLSSGSYLGEGNFKVTNGANDQILHFDFENMSLSIKSWAGNNRYGLMKWFNPHYVGKAYTYTGPIAEKMIYAVKNGLPHLNLDYDTVIFININCDKILMNDNHLYELLLNGTLGEDLGEISLSKSTTGLSYFKDNYYFDYINKILYSFDEDTNTFNEEMDLSTASLKSSYVISESNSKYGDMGLPFIYTLNNITYYFVFEPNTSKKIGFNLDGEFYRALSGGYGQSNDLLEDKKLYMEDGTTIIGTMPNNGALNYTPSTSQQNIPAGYTTGGTISAVTSAIDNNIVAENIKKDVEILGVTGTLEGTATPNIYAQLTEPSNKNGIWLQTDKEVEHYIADDNVYAGGIWQPDGYITNFPRSIYSESTVTIGTDIYILGGDGGKTKNYKYDTLTDEYTLLTDIPYNHINATAVTIGTDIFLMGDNSNNHYCYKYDTLTDTYTQLRSTPYDFYSGSSVVIGTDIYLLGSSSSSYGTYCYKYNTLTDTYTKMTNIPYVFRNAGAVAFGTDIYLLGSGHAYYSNYCYKYNTLNDTYTQMTDIPFGFYEGSVNIIGSNIYMFGGTGSNEAYRRVYKYNINSDTYTQMADIPSDYYWGSSTVVGTSVYLIGGGNSGDRQKVRRFILQGKTYETDKSVVISNGNNYTTQLLNTNFEANYQPKYNFSDVYYYTEQDGLDDTIPSYYGDGTSWVKFKN